MKQDNRLKFIHIRQINQNNVNDIYQKQFNRFLFDYSDEVNIDGKIYSNTGYDKMMRFNLGYLKNEKGEPNFKKIYANGIKDGFKLTENDFIEYELEQIVDYTPKGLTEKKQLKTYKEYLEKRLSKLNKSKDTEHHFDSNQPLKNYSDFIEDYQIFFKNLKNNYASKIEDYYNVLDNAEIGDIGHRAVKEIKDLLLLPNNNAETLKNTIKNDLGKLKKLHDEAIKEHKFFNAKNENNKYLPTFIKAVDDLNIFVDTITLLIENKSTTIKEPQQETKTDAPPKKEYNSSQFNEHTYKLFCHIVDEYKNEAIVKYINIWYYLKRNIDKTKYKNILFNFTQKTYKEFVKSYGIEIKKFEKATYKYDEVELPILENITDTYYKSLKQI